MPALFFDAAILHADRLELPNGPKQKFEDLGVADDERLTLCARVLTVKGTPARDLDLVAERLDVSSAGESFSSGPRFVRIVADEIVGSLDVVCRGQQGDPGEMGEKGDPGPFKTIVVQNAEPGQVGKPTRVKVATGPGGKGGTGGDGKEGSPGGTALVFYRAAAERPTAAAPGGKGGPGGLGGFGGDPVGDSPAFPVGPRGETGREGPEGPDGFARVTQLATTADLWSMWAQSESPAGIPEAWAAHRLTIAEYLYRRGQPNELAQHDLAQARERLEELSRRPGNGEVLERCQTLLTQLFEHVTYLGIPRDIDITPHVDFAAKDNKALLDFALSLLEMGTTLAQSGEVLDSLKQMVVDTADEARRAAGVATKRGEQATMALGVAKSSTDLARGRVQNLMTKSVELQKAMHDIRQQDQSISAQIDQIVAVGQAIVGAATGVGAVAAIGQGFVSLQAVANGSTGLFDLAGDVEKHLAEGSMQKFKRSFKDLHDSAKSIIDVGAMALELGKYAANPALNPLVRELAAVNRERLLLEQEVAVHVQMEKEAQLGVDAALFEERACLENAGDAEQLVGVLEQKEFDADVALIGILDALRPLLDRLSAHLFLTLRAREIYLVKDPLTPVQFDLGQLHPDRRRLLSPGEQLAEIRAAVSNTALRVIEWSSLVGELLDVGDLSRTPVPFWFSTDDPVLLDPLRSSGRMGFGIAIADLLEEDGSDLYEVKFESVTVMLHGATMDATGAAIKLTQLGRWSSRRRPEAGVHAGEIKDFALRPQELLLEAVPVPGGVKATLSEHADPNQPPIAIWGRGIAGDWELYDQQVDEGGGPVSAIDLAGVTKVEIGFDTMALSKTGGPSAGRLAQRELRPLAGWPVEPGASRPPTPIPPRGGRRAIPRLNLTLGAGVVDAGPGPLTVIVRATNIAPSTEGGFLRIKASKKFSMTAGTNVKPKGSSTGQDLLFIVHGVEPGETATLELRTTVTGFEGSIQLAGELETTGTDGQPITARGDLVVNTGQFATI
jgi:hypothetical protein